MGRLSAAPNGLVNISSSIGPLSLRRTCGLRIPSAPPAVAGRRVSTGDGRAKSREMAGRASADEKLAPPDEADEKELPVEYDP